MKKLVLPFILLGIISQLFAQEIPTEKYRLSITFEPLNYAMKGHSVWVGLRYKQFEAGVFSFSIHSKTNTLFKDYGDLDIDLKNGLAVYTRFYLQNKPSSPFVGALIGRERWDIQNAAKTVKKSLRNGFVTPQIGYSWSTWNNRLLINPNFRMIVPFAAKGASEVDGQTVELKKMGFFPGLDLGLGLNFD